MSSKRKSKVPSKVVPEVEDELDPLGGPAELQDELDGPYLQGG